MQQRQAQHGFSLIELMISLLLAALVLAGVAALFQQSKSSAVQDEQIARMQENGRFALRVMSRELSMMGYFAGMLSLKPDVKLDTTDADGTIACDTSTNNDWGASLVHENDADDMATLDGAIKETSLQFYDNATASDYDCIDDVDILDGTDVVAIKRVSDTANFEYDDTGAQIATLAAVTGGNVYFKTNRSSAELYVASGTNDNGAAVPDVLSTVRQYQPYIFYVRPYSVTAGDAIPTLVRETLVGTTMTAQPLVEGVENMQIEFGIDGTDDGNEPDYYTLAPDATELGDAVTTRIYLLLRSIKPVTGYLNDKTYNLGAEVLGPFNDAYYRRVYTTTVQMRNSPKLKFSVME